MQYGPPLKTPSVSFENLAMLSSNTVEGDHPWLAYFENMFNIAVYINIALIVYIPNINNTCMRVYPTVQMYRYMLHAATRSYIA